MAAALAVTNCKVHDTATINLTGDTAAAQRLIQIVDPDGRTQTFNVTCDGSGAASVKFVPQLAGKYTVNEVTLMSTVVSTSINSSHL